MGSFFSLTLPKFLVLELFISLGSLSTLNGIPLGFQRIPNASHLFSSRFLSIT